MPDKLSFVICHISQFTKARRTTDMHVFGIQFEVDIHF